MEDEEWRPIYDFPDYQVSSWGNIIHVDRPNTFRTTTLNHQGFPTLVLFDKNHSGGRYLRQVNKLVARAFLGPPPPRMDSVWHLDGDFLNCRAENLKWDMRARVLEWNDMHRTGQPKFRTPRVMSNKTGLVFNNAYDCALHVGDIESAIVAHIERYPAQHVDRARFRYILGE